MKYIYSKKTAYFALISDISSCLDIKNCSVSKSYVCVVLKPGAAGESRTQLCLHED